MLSDFSSQTAIQGAQNLEKNTVIEERTVIKHHFPFLSIVYTVLATSVSFIFALDILFYTRLVIMSVISYFLEFSLI